MSLYKLSSIVVYFRDGGIPLSYTRLEHDFVKDNTFFPIDMPTSQMALFFILFPAITVLSLLFVLFSSYYFLLKQRA